MTENLSHSYQGEKKKISNKFQVLEISVQNFSLEKWAHNIYDSESVSVMNL